MNATGPEPETGETSTERTESDDYDLLTFGEVAARLAELLAAERAALIRLSEQEHPDPAAQVRLRERIEQLESLESDYRQQEQTNDVFTRRFGADIQASSTREDKPDWT